MGNSILNSSSDNLQTIFVFKDENEMKSRSFDNFVNNLIRENGNYTRDGFSLFAGDLPDFEKKIFLSYLVGPLTFEDLTENHFRTKEAFIEYEPEMQFAINEHLDECFHAYMDEMHQCLTSLT